MAGRWVPGAHHSPWEHFGGAQYALSHFGLDTGVTAYTGLIALALNIAVAVAVSLVLRARSR